MANGILTLLGDPERARRIGLQARATAENVFAWHHLIDNLEHWYYEILSSIGKTRGMGNPTPEPASLENRRSDSANII